MRFFIVVLLFVSAFTQHVVQHPKFKTGSTQNPPEKTYRQMVYQKNLDHINAHNSKGLSHQEGVNEFTYLTPEQFGSKHYGFIFRQKLQLTVDTSDRQFLSTSTKNTDTQSTKFTATTAATVPTTFFIDYTVSPMYVTTVKNQKSCGSCWAFAGIAQIQSLYLKRNNLFLDLSEQQMVDCIPVTLGNFGCGGGYQTTVMNYAKTHGITTERVYSYQQVQGACNTVRDATGTFKISSYQYLMTCQDIALYLVQQLPVLICIYADNNWQSYASGVIATCSVDTTSGHCIQLVGAKSDGTTTTATNYWKFKNSWGYGWGENGFFRAYRNAADNTNGYCGLCTGGLIPIY